MERAEPAERDRDRDRDGDEHGDEHGDGHGDGYGDGYDVVIATDLRLPGGTSASVAEEVRAQAAAGYRTGLVQVDSPLVARARPVNDRIARCVHAGIADILDPPADAARPAPAEPVRTRLLVLRHPRVFADADTPTPPIDADVHVLVANQAPTDRTGETRLYDPEPLAEDLERRFGAPFTWAPIGPLVRETLDPWRDRLPILADDWVNVIAVADWETDRTEPVGALPVIGRHGRDTWDKWPATASELLAAYPDGPDVRVEILGGADTPERILGRRPANWHVRPYGAVPVDRFLAGIDLFVYYHHPQTVEAFGRTILEALASGAPAVLPHHFERLFGPACTYSSPGGVRDLAHQLHRDRDEYARRSARGRRAVAERFSHETHAERVRDLIGEPESRTRPPVAPATASPTASAPAAPAGARRILFVTSNGAGVGHLMRLMAMARRTGPAFSPLFVTMSQAISVVRETGFPVEYIPSSRYSGLTYTEWHDLLHARMDEIITAHDAAAIVFDGTHPYRGLLRIREDHPGLTFVWSRRAMWKPGIDNPIGFFSRHFDLVIEPGEFAEEVDAGATVARRDEAVRVPPVLFLDEDELLPRREAREQLGLDPDRPAALIQLGAGNINAIDSVLGMVVRRLDEVPDLQISLAESAIAEEPSAGLEVHRFSVYPLARYLRAFDFSIAASGYNTFHELVGFAVPTIFIPNLETQADDQGARADYAERVGVGLSLRDVTPESLDRAVTTILGPQRRERMRERARELDRGNGAQAAIRAIETAVGARTDAEHPARTADGPGRRHRDAPAGPPGRERAAPSLLRRWVWALRAALRRTDRWLRTTVAGLIRAGDARFKELPEGVKRVARPIARPIAARLRPEDRTATILFVLQTTSQDRIERLVADVRRLERLSTGFRPVFVTFTDDFSALRRHGVLFEYLLPAELWRDVDGADDWSAYVRRRLRTLARTHGVDHVVTMGTGDMGTSDIGTRDIGRRDKGTGDAVVDADEVNPVGGLYDGLIAAIVDRS